MKKRIWFTASLLSTLLFSTSIAELPAKPHFLRPFSQNRNTITGQVFDEQRRPIAQVYVELQNEVYSTLARSRTDGSGRFLFTNLSSGKFYVRVLPYGTNFEEQTQEVEMVSFVTAGRSTSENAQKDFYLRLRRNESESRKITGTVFVQDVPRQAQKSYKKAVSYLEENQIEAGIKELQNALKLFPDYFLALERLGSQFVKLQKYTDAQEIYKKAVTINPQSYDSWYGLSYANYAIKQSEKAVEAAEKAVSLNPQSVEARLILGISERQAKLYEKAEKSLKQAGRLAKGKSADAHWNLALLYAHNLKRYKDAADELELYLKVQPNAENAEAVKKLIKQFRQKSGNN